MKIGINNLKGNRKLVIGLIIVLLIVSAGAYKFIGSSKAKPASNINTSSSDNFTTITGSGIVKSSNTFDIASKVSGKITKVYFKEGDKVKANDLMYELDNSDAEMNVTKLSNALEQAKSALKNDSAQAGYLNVTAPFSGQVSNILVKKGNVIIQGTPILTLADRTKLKLTVPFNSAQINKMSIGQKAELYVNGTYQVAEGTVSYINPNFHATDESGKLYNVEISINNPGTLKEGQKANAVVYAGGEQIASPEDGVLSYVNSVVIESNAAGQVQNINLKEDQYVSEGTSLITLTNNAVTAASDADNLKIQDLQSQLEYAKKQLDDYKIYAPIDGTISSQNKKVGELISSGEIVSSLADLDHMELVIDIDDTDIANVKLGQKASVKIDAFPETSSKPLELEVTKIPVEGKTVNGSTTYPITLSIDNEPDIKIGMNANIEIKVPVKK